MNQIEALAMRVALLESRLEALTHRLSLVRAECTREMMTYAAVADHLDVGVRELRRMVQQGRFPKPVRYNRKIVRFRRQDVLAYLEGDWKEDR